MSFRRRVSGLCLASLLSCFGGGLAADAAAQEQPSAQDAVLLPGQVVAGRHTILSAELPGKIDRIAVREGDRFEKGQTLIDFDCVIQKAQLDEARAALAAAETAKAVQARLLELNSTGTLEVDLSASEAAKAAARVNSARAVMSKCIIKAPFSGRVAEKTAEAHQYVQAGQPILEILDDGALEAEIILPSAWLPSVAPGDSVRLFVDETGKTYAATIARIGAKVDAVSHSVKVVAEIVGDAPDLMAGMSGRLEITPPKDP